MMKRNILFSVLAAWAIWFAGSPANAQEVQEKRTYEGNIVIEPVRVEQDAGLLHVDLNVILNSVKIKSAAGLDFIPLIVTPNYTRELPILSIKGNSEFMAHKRKMKFMSKKDREEYIEPYEVHKGKHWRNDTLKYRQTIPYESWMANGTIALQYDACGCGNIDSLYMEPLATIIPQTDRFRPYLAYVVPEVEQIKAREKIAECFLDFVVNKVDIRPEYMNNPKELAKIHTIIDELKADPSISINRLDIIGYASPEGPLDNNKWLSENRAKALRNYLASQYDFPRSIYSIRYGGENWDGLVAALDTIPLEGKYDVFDIIDNYTIEGGRSRKVRELNGGKTYKFMLEKIYPTLRVAICKVGYSIKNFDLEEAKRIMKERPENLSLNEMFIVANTYKEASPEFIEVFETAARLYPENEVAALNAAASAIMRDDLATAEKLMSKINPRSYPAEYNNTMGVISLLKKDFVSAERYFNRAGMAGLVDAKLNLKELPLYQD